MIETIELPNDRRLVRAVEETPHYSHWGKRNGKLIKTTITIERLYSDAMGAPSWQPEYELYTCKNSDGSPFVSTSETRKLDHDRVLDIVAALFGREEKCQVDRLRAENEALKSLAQELYDRCGIDEDPGCFYSWIVENWQNRLFAAAGIKEVSNGEHDQMGR